MEIFAGRRRDINKGYWMSFENHPRLEETKKNIYVRCLPCLERLNEQLCGTPEKLHLENPLNCWKVVVVFKDLDECLDLLCLFQEEPGIAAAPGKIRGRIGTNDKNSPNVVIIFQMLSVEERDELTGWIKKLAPRINPNYTLISERGCGDLYGSLCGDWQNWSEITPILHKPLVPFVREKVQKLLRGEY